MSNDIGPFLFINGDTDQKGRFSGMLQVGHDTNMHIQKVHVFTGGDDYEESDTVSVTPAGDGKLAVARINRSGFPTMTRIRGEPAVRLYLDMENGEAAVITISHHKGNIFFHADEVLKEDLNHY